MSATTCISFKMSHALTEAVGNRWQRLGYPSRASYLKSLVRQDFAGKVKHHSLGRSVDRMSLADQDHFDTYLSKHAVEGGKA